MSRETASTYQPLLGQASIRVLLLAPGQLDDEVFCWLLPVDLDADHEWFPTSSPRPVDVISMIVGKTSGGEERKFVMSFDAFWDDKDDKDDKGKDEMATHPFQRYTALSYVWGDMTDPEYIILGGERRFTVTRNLHSALRSLRSPHECRRLWVDAVCINQADYQEKEKQIRLMRRIYQQAENVVAYAPQTEEDQENILKLVPKILDAGKLYKQEVEKDRKEAPRVQDTDLTGPVPLLPETDPITALVESDQKEGTEPAHAMVQLQQVNMTLQSSRFLENFGLPPADSPLWGSWRRLFASPYFRRIWILQEFALAKKLQFGFGSKRCNAEYLLIAQHFIKEYSGAKNAEYLGHSFRGDPEMLTRDAVTGGLLARMMFTERLLAPDESAATTLIEKLRRGRSFEATDFRDKIYALLGLVKDGALFEEHVSYAPEETYLDTFTRFAKLFIEMGQGFEVLHQAGIKSCDVGLPSWVPNWADSTSPTGTLSPADSGVRLQTSSIPVDKDKLLLPGAFLAHIREISDWHSRGFSSGGGTGAIGSTLVDFVRGFVKGNLLLLRFFEQDNLSFEDVMEALFEVMVQYKTSSHTPSGDSDERASLRNGFKSFMGFIKAMGMSGISRLKDGQMIQVQTESPHDYHKFLDRAFQTTANARLCVTNNGYVGLVSDRAEVGDRVVAFDGNPVAFVLRPSGQKAEGDGKTDDRESFRLVGNGYFCHPTEGKNMSSTEGKQDILLI